MDRGDGGLQARNHTSRTSQADRATRASMVCGKYEWKVNTY